MSPNSQATIEILTSFTNDHYLRGPLILRGLGSKIVASRPLKVTGGPSGNINPSEPLGGAETKKSYISISLMCAYNPQVYF